MNNAAIQIERIGNSQFPVIIIDGGSSAIEAIRQVARNGLFNSDSANNYPGIRAPIPREMVVAYVKPLLPYLYRVFKIPTHLKPQPLDNYFSLITLKNGELNHAQTIPHFDTNNPYQIAMVHYLNEGFFGGTSFYRHADTGWEYIDQRRRSEYLHLVNDCISGSPSYPLNYCTAAHPLFECHKTIDYRENRLLIFNGYLLHSTAVNLDTDIDASPLSGRLTANLFIRFE